MKKDHYYMQKALDSAKLALLLDEVPVGCVIVDENGDIIAQTHNQVIAKCDATAHAEILAIQAASLVVANFRLEKCSIFTSLEPCTMCAGAILNARLARLVYATREPKSGVVESVCNLFAQPWYKSKLEISGGILQAKSEKLLKDFFAKKR